MHFLSGHFNLDGGLLWFFRQAGWAYDQIIRFPDESPWVSYEQVGAAPATETKFFIVPASRGRLIPVDSQPDEGTATGRANEGFHPNGLLEYEWQRTFMNR